MPQTTLVSHSVAYNVYSKISAADPQVQPSVSGLQLYIPPAAVEAANAGVIVKVGRPNSVSAPTSITNAEVQLAEGGSYEWPANISNDISLQERWVNGSTDSCVLYWSVVQA